MFAGESSILASGLDLVVQIKSYGMNSGYVSFLCIQRFNFPSISWITNIIYLFQW